MGTSPSARELLKAVVDRYRSLSSYKDHGVVRLRLRSGDPVLPFETFYEAPGEFRFVLDRPHPYKALRHRVTRHVLEWRNGQSTLETIQSDGDVRSETAHDLDMAIALATGISHGSAHTIASLLFPDVQGWALSELGRPRYRSPRCVDGIWCHRITGLRHRRPLTVYVGVDDLMIRKIEDRKGGVEEVRLSVDVLRQP